MCIGKKVTLKAMKVSQKWILPSVSLIMRPNIFGNQKAMPAKMPNMLPRADTWRLSRHRPTHDNRPFARGRK